MVAPWIIKLSNRHSDRVDLAQFSMQVNGENRKIFAL